MLKEIVQNLDVASQSQSLVQDREIAVIHFSFIHSFIQFLDGLSLGSSGMGSVMSPAPSSLYILIYK